MNVFENLIQDPSPTLETVKTSIAELIDSGYQYKYDHEFDAFLLKKKNQVYMVARNRQSTPTFKSKKTDILRIPSKDWSKVKEELEELLDEDERKTYTEHVRKQIRGKRIKNLPIFDNNDHLQGTPKN
jgi:hypothetical protein